MPNNIVLIHHITTLEGLNDLLKDAPTGAYKLVFDGKVEMTQVADGIPELPLVEKNMEFVPGDVRFSYIAQKELISYDKPSLTGKQRAIPIGRKMDVSKIEKNQDGTWGLVYKSNTVEMWIKI